jgi:hypothetical protein
MHKAAVMEPPLAHIEIEVVLAIVLSSGSGLRGHDVCRLMPVPSPRCCQQQKRRYREEIACPFQHVSMVARHLVF